MLKRVLHLRSSGGLLGTENVIIELAKNSPLFGYQSVIGAIKNQKDPCPEFLSAAHDSQIETIIFEGRRRVDFSRLKKIRRFMYENRIDILHCHGYKEDFYGILMPVHIPKIATNHLWKITYTHLWKIAYTRARIYALTDAFFLRFFKKVVGVSDEIIEKMRSYGLKNTIKIPNGVDVNKFTIRPKALNLLRQFELNQDDIILGMISSLTEEKGHKFAINVLKNIKKEFPNIKLLIVGGVLGGSENYKFEIEKQVEELGMDDTVIFAGKQRNIPELLSIIDVFLLPSLKEGLPIALLEAMASGKAVIATRVGENANVITHNKTGLLIQPSNEDQLEKVILELLRKKEKIIDLGRNARETVVKHYSSKIMARRYCELYDSVTSS